MINSLCGSSNSLKEKCLQPNSSNQTNTHSKKNAPNSCGDLEQINVLTPQSLNLPSLKFDLDGDVEVQSPDSSMWEAFFNDHLDNDFMISSPIRNINPNSPQASTYNNCNYNYAQGMQIQSLSGCSPPRFASQIGSLNSNNQQKGKGLSPLHRVFNSPNNQYMQHVENLSLPAIEEFLEDFQGDVDHFSSTKVSSECFDMETPISTILDSLTMQNSSSYGASVNEESTLLHGGNSSSQISQESDMYHQMGSMASASLSQALQQERYQEKHQKMQAQQQSLTVPIQIGIEQVIKSFLCLCSPKILINSNLKFFIPSLTE